MQEAIGEDVAAVEIARDLDFVHGQEFGFQIERHGLDRADQIARGFGRDLLFASDQSRGRFALGRHHAIINLARQQPQRQPDHARGMPQHALDGEMGLAGIGRAKHGLEDGTAARAHGGRLGAGAVDFKRALWRMLR